MDTFNSRASGIHHQQTFSSSYFDNDQPNYLKESVFSNRYHIAYGPTAGGLSGPTTGGFGSLQYLSNRLQQSPPLFDYQWLSSHHPLHNSFLVDRERNFDRIQQWLTYQHQYSGHPPPDEECQSCCSLVEKHSPVDEYTDYLPRYKSEELLQTCNKESEHSNSYRFRGIEVKRHFSPDLSRRRYSPRSDPTLNKTSTEESTFNQFSSENIYEKDREERKDYPTPLNYYFYQSGKGNTFPRRRKITDSDENRVLPKLPLIKQHQREHHRPLSFDERIMPNQYPFIDELISNERQPAKRKPRPISMLEGRSFILNGISMKDSKQESVIVERGSSMLGNISRDAQRLLIGDNTPDIALAAPTAVRKSELSDLLPKHIVSKYNSKHIRVSSAPATTPYWFDGKHQCRSGDANKEHNDDIQYRYQTDSSARTSSLIRKVKASSWPKRVVLPAGSNYVEMETTGPVRNSWNKMENEYTTKAKSEEKIEKPSLSQNSNIKEEEITISLVGSDISDKPPERPPLPTHRSCDASNSKLHLTNLCSPNELVASTPNFYSEPILLKQRSNRADSSYHPSPRDRYGSFVSGCSCASITNDLSKTVSMSLKDLIRIHEQEIARVSAGVSTNSINKPPDLMREKSRNSSLSETRNSSWKRHTTIGLVANYSLDQFQEDNSCQQNEEVFSNCFSNDSLISKDKHPKVKNIQNNGFFSASSELPFSPAVKSESESWSLSSANKTKPTAPIPFPKPKRTSMVIIEPSFININSAREQFANLTSPGVVNFETSVRGVRCKHDVSIQTENEPFGKNEILVENLRNQIKRMYEEFEDERQDLRKKLDEQKKVANAYQKLEDRYRRKVCSLKKLMRHCTCNDIRIRQNENDHAMTRQSLPSSFVLGDHRGVSVQKVDNILHQLEAWLNHQTGGVPTDTSEVSSILGGSINGDLYPRYKISSDYYASPPLEIIDKIVATSV